MHPHWKGCTLYRADQQNPNLLYLGLDSDTDYEQLEKYLDLIENFAKIEKIELPIDKQEILKAFDPMTVRINHTIKNTPDPIVE